MKVFAVLLVCTVSALANPLLDEDVNLRIINGIEARPEDFPHHVALQMFENFGDNTFYKCGGALVSPDTVISAAHCFGTLQQPRRYGKVSVGSNRYLQGETVEIARYRMHERHNVATNDIAIVKLVRPVTLGPRVQTIGISYNFVPAEQRIEVSGFGTIGDRVDTNIFYWTPLVTAPTRECNYNAMNGDIMICARAGPQGQATCQGDSGGPVIIRNGNQRDLVGLVSFGAESCMQRRPVGFTRISAYRDWIRNNMNF